MRTTKTVLQHGTPEWHRSTKAMTAMRLPASTATATASPAKKIPVEEADVYYKNCSEARAAGVTPIHQGQPGYRPGLDRDGDGIACE